MTGVGVVAALAAEARALGPAARRGADSRELSRLGTGALLAVSGIGGKAAGLAARTLVEARASSLVSFGLAGGLDPKLHAGSLILPDQVIRDDGARFATSRDWRERLAAALSPRAVADGALLTSERALTTPAQKARAFHDTGAVAVDMESGAVAEVASLYKLPFIAVRVIVDTAADGLPPVVMAASREGTVRIGRLGLGLLTAPGEIAALIRLALRYRSAMSALRLVGSRLV